MSLIRSNVALSLRERGAGDRQIEVGLPSLGGRGRIPLAEREGYITPPFPLPSASRSPTRLLSLCGRCLPACAWPSASRRGRGCRRRSAASLGGRRDAVSD